jgi:hypothetical protein
MFTGMRAGSSPDRIRRATSATRRETRCIQSSGATPSSAPARTSGSPIMPITGSLRSVNSSNSAVICARVMFTIGSR